MLALRDRIRLISGLLIAVMMLATGPFAHAGLANAPATAAEHAIAHQSDGAHAVASMAHAPDQKPAHHSGLQCCGDLGLCGVSVLAAGADIAVAACSPYSRTPLPLLRLAGLYEPGLDVPPPRHS